MATSKDFAVLDIENGSQDLGMDLQFQDFGDTRTQPAGGGGGGGGQHEQTISFTEFPDSAQDEMEQDKVTPRIKRLKVEEHIQPNILQNSIPISIMEKYTEETLETSTMETETMKSPFLLPGAVQITAVLPEGVQGEPEFTQTAVLKVKDKRFTSQVIRELSIKLPVPKLGHLKRVRKIVRLVDDVENQGGLQEARDSQDNIEKKKDMEEEKVEEGGISEIQNNKRQKKCMENPDMSGNIHGGLQEHRESESQNNIEKKKIIEDPDMSSKIQANKFENKSQTQKNKIREENNEESSKNNNKSQEQKQKSVKKNVKDIEELYVYLDLLENLGASTVEHLSSNNITPLNTLDTERVLGVLKAKGVNISNCEGDVFASKVAKFPPRVRKMYDKVHPLWPCTFHEDSYLTQLSSPNFFSASEEQMIIQYMNKALELSLRENGAKNIRGESRPYSVGSMEDLNARIRESEEQIALNNTNKEIELNLKANNKGRREENTEDIKCREENRPYNKIKRMETQPFKSPHAVGVVIVDSHSGEIVASSADLRHTHPLKHAVMVAIDNVAAKQGGGAWTSQLPLNTSKLTPQNSSQLPHSPDISQLPTSPSNTSQLPPSTSQHPTTPSNTSQLPTSPSNTSQLPLSASQLPTSPSNTSQLPPSTSQLSPSPQNKHSIDSNLDPSFYICTGYDVYVTREPCMMCAMALLHSRVRRVFYLSPVDWGALESKTKLHALPGINHRYELMGEDEGADPSNLKAGASFWTFEFYQQFFDVESKQVGDRILWSMVPKPGVSYLQSYIRPNPDLYGPFWICVTLAFTTAITGNLANYLATPPADTYIWRYEFRKVTLAASAIFAYAWLVPLAVWGLVVWRGSRAKISLLELLCIYGYSLAIFVPVSILWMVPQPWFKWCLAIVAPVLSGSVLVRTVWPSLSHDSQKIALGIAAFILLLHATLALGFMLYFFSAPEKTSPVAVPETNPDVPTAAPALNQSASKDPAPAKPAPVKPDVDSGGGGSSSGNVKKSDPESISPKSIREVKPSESQGIEGDKIETMKATETEKPIDTGTPKAKPIVQKDTETQKDIETSIQKDTETQKATPIVQKDAEIQKAIDTPLKSGDVAPIAQKEASKPQTDSSEQP